MMHRSRKEKKNTDRCVAARFFCETPGYAEEATRCAVFHAVVPFYQEAQRGYYQSLAATSLSIFLKVLCVRGRMVAGQSKRRSRVRRVEVELAGKMMTQSFVEVVASRSRGGLVAECKVMIARI